MHSYSLVHTSSDGMAQAIERSLTQEDARLSRDGSASKQGSSQRSAKQSTLIWDTRGCKKQTEIYTASNPIR
jgi:hypothetical protein